MKLLTPGPVQVPGFIVDAIARQPQFHRSEDFKAVLREVTDKLAKVHKGMPVIMPGTGTLAVDTAVYNYVDPGDKVVALVSGEFGERLAETLESRGCVVHRVKWEYGSAPPPDVVEDAIRSRGLDGIRAIAVVHNESSTGAANRYIERYQAVADAYGAVLIVDSVSGIPAEPIRSRVDVVATASHKAFMTPPGAAIVYLSREPTARTPVPPSMDLRRYIKAMEKLETPYTPPINIVYGLNAALDYILRLGVENYHSVHVERAGILYGRVALRPVAKDEFRSCTITAFYAPRAREIVEALRRYGYIIAGGVGRLRDSVIRIGVMGDVSPDDLRFVADLVNKHAA